MQNKNLSLLLMVGGILTIIGSFVWMNASGLGGIFIAPLFYIVGPGLLLAGIVKEFEHRGRGNRIRNVSIVTVLILTIIIGCIVVNLRISKQQKRTRHCEAKYSYDHQAPGYPECLNGQD